MLSSASLVAGVLGLNGVFLLVGYAVLATALRGSSIARWASYAGVALLVGASLIGVSLCVATVAGARPGLAAFAAAAAAFGSAGLLAARLVPEARRARLRTDPPRAEAASRAESVLATVFTYCLAAIGALAVVGAFRSSPWLDDSWFFWLPKGIALDRLGLDQRLFTGNDEYVAFANLGYPLWWPIVANLDMRLVGAIDLRAMNAQLVLLMVAFVGAAARLLWGFARPFLVAACLLLLAASPQLLRQTQGGGADLPEAAFLALALLAAAGWLVRPRGLVLVLVFVFSAGALSTRAEAGPQLLVLLLVVTALAWTRSQGSLRALWVAAAGAFATAVPWFAWHWLSTGDLVGLGSSGAASLLERAPRLERGARDLVVLVDPRAWPLMVPLSIGIGVLLSIRERRLLWLGPAMLMVSVCALWLLAIWLLPRDPIGGAVSRAVNPLAFLAALSLAPIGERLLSRRRSQHVAAAVQGRD